MRNTYFLILVVVMAGLTSGCMSTNWSANSSPLAVRSHADVKATLDIGDRVSGEATLTKILFFTLGPTKYADGVAYSMAGSDGSSDGSALSDLLAAFDMVAKAKAAAAYNAVSAGAGTDIIINPRYKVDIQDYFFYKVVKASVEGTGAKIRGFAQQ